MRVQKAHYLAESVRLTNRYNKHLRGFCVCCQELRPLIWFSVSEMMALERLEDASCLLHAQFWTCPHHSLDYTYKESRAYSDFLRSHPFGLSYCDNFQCRAVFRHKHIYARWPSLDHYIKSEIKIFRVVHQGGPCTMRDTIQRHLTKDRLQTAISMIHAPVCDHYLLSDEEVRKNFDPVDLDLEDWIWWSVRLPFETNRIIRGSDNSCSYCQALGVRTEFRFLARALQSYAYPGMAAIELCAVVLRSFAMETQFGRKPPEEAWRCHGISKRRLARFRETWTLTSSGVPRVYPAESTESTAG